ncbi:glycosyltransferase [Microbacterium sp. SSM24]|nr:glycosyltransferase [Microbacterium sp. SSM24]MCW3493092.1 glycosyltransferase [Microbacterium sp. SSM24]
MPVTESATPHDHSAEARPDAPKAPLKILIGADTFLPHVNGAARFAERLAAGLVARGHEVHVMAPSATHRTHGRFTEVIEGQPMTMHRIPSWRWYPHDWLTFVMPFRSKYYSRRVLAEVQPDIVHIQSHIVIGRGLSRIATQRGIPIVATNHVMAENVLDFTVLPASWTRYAIKLAWEDAKRTFDLTRAVTTPTRKAAEFLERTIEIDNVIPVSCGIEASNYTADLTPRDAHRLVFVGRLTTEKQIDVVLRAVARLDPALDVRFDIVGKGDQRRNLEELMLQLGLSDRVHFHGHTTDEELRALLTNASLFVIASIAELQSIATMEAMASGLPIVAADAVALPHLVHDGENGYLFEPGNVDDLVAKLTTVLTQSPEERLRMQQASLEGVKVHDMKRTLDTFEALYRDEPLPE